MSRSEARIRIGIWDDADFMALSVEQQWLYLFLLSQPDVEYTGVMPMRERRWAKKAPFPRQAFEAALAGLESARFIVTDEDVEELLIRSFMRNDEVYRQPNLVRSALRSLSSVSSSRIRAVLFVEVQRISGAEDIPAGSRQPLAALLAALKPSVVGTGESDSPIEEGISEPQGEPFAEPISEGFNEPIGEPISEPFPEPIAEPQPEGVDLPKGEGGKGKGEVLTVVSTKASSSASSLPKPGSDDDPDFTLFWDIWPRKVGKGQARSAWRSAIKKADPLTIIVAAEAYRDRVRDFGTEIKFVPHPSTWLNGERWGDQVPVAEAQPQAIPPAVAWAY